MPSPQLNLSLSTTDNGGSPFYGGYKERQKFGEFDSAVWQYTITITITNEQVGETELDLNNEFFNKISLPTFKMLVTDDCTEERTFYEVTRDIFLLNELKINSTSGFSFLGINVFKHQVFNLPMMAFEPKISSMETFEVSKFRTKKENYLSYTLHRDHEKAILVAGELPIEFLNRLNGDYFFYVIDHSGGQKFIRDIAYREKFIKSIPKVEINLIKRKKNIKEYELGKKGNINKIKYL